MRSISHQLQNIIFHLISLHLNGNFIIYLRRPNLHIIYIEQNRKACQDMKFMCHIQKNHPRSSNITSQHMWHHPKLLMIFNHHPKYFRISSSSNNKKIASSSSPILKAPNLSTVNSYVQERNLERKIRSETHTSKAADSEPGHLALPPSNKSVHNTQISFHRCSAIFIYVLSTLYIMCC